MAAPDFAELQWTPAPGGGWTAMTTKPFWNLFNVQRAGFHVLGFTTKPVGGEWIVTAPDIDASNREKFVSVLAAAREALAQAQLKNAARFEHQDRMSAEIDAARRAKWQADLAAREAMAAEALAMKNSKRVAAARAAAIACLAKWGEATMEKPTLRRLIAKELLTSSDLLSIDAAIRTTEIENAKRARIAAGIQPAGSVWWPADVVERAIRYLTGLDDDHATEPNGEGWDASDSSWGHWCCAMLSIDRELAIKRGRAIVGVHRGQLLAILSDAEMTDVDAGGHG